MFEDAVLSFLVVILIILHSVVWQQKEVRDVSINVICDIVTRIN